MKAVTKKYLNGVLEKSDGDGPIGWPIINRPLQSPPARLASESDEDYLTIHEKRSDDWRTDHPISGIIGR